MPTQVPPSRLDSSKDFSSLVPSAFAKANAAFEAANTASGAAATSTPKISSIVYPGNDTAAATAGGQTVTLNGAGFNAGASVLINGSYAGVVSVANSTSLSFTTPSNSGGTYILYVINTDGGTGISVPGISYSGTPSWSNAAGSLATVYETAAVNTQLTATGDIADGTITYSLQSGTLPPGSSLNSSTGLLSGTTQVTENSTTYNFTIRATDGQNQDTDRAFSITISPDVVTWSSPADGTVTALFQNEAMSNVTLSATSAAGQSVSYTANALPTGVTISGSNVTGTPTVLGNTISVITATSANTNRTTTRTFTWVVSVANDTFFKNTTLLLNGETTVTPFINEASANSLALTIQGDTKPVLFNPYTPGYYSNYFDGTGDYLTVPGTNITNIFTGDFTIEAWLYPTAAFSSSWVTSDGGFTDIPVMICNASPTSSNYFWAFGPSSTGTVRFITSSIYFNTVTSTATCTVNAWNHLALVKTGTTYKIYVNGVGTAGTTITTSPGTAFSDAAGISIGANNGKYITGYLSNARIVKGTAVYTANFTPPTAPLTAIANTSLLTCQSNRLIDNSTNNFTITKAGDVSVSSAIPFTANSSYSTYGSTYFDGTGDYLSIGTTQLWTPSNNLTIEGWFNISTTGDRCIFSKDSGSSGSSRGLFIYITSTGAVSVFYSVSGSSEAFATSSTGLVVANQWYHLAVVKNGSSCAVYLNGVSIATFTAATIACPASPTNYIGIFNASYPMLGYISNLRIVNGTAVYTSAFTPPASPLTAVANTSLLTLQYNGGATNQGIIDNSNFNNIVTRFGNTSQGTFSPYSVTGWSNYFDGTGDFLSTPANAAFSYGTGDYTIETWIYLLSYTGSGVYGYICGAGASGQQDQFVMNPTTGTFYHYDGGATYPTSSTAIPLNTWTHIAACRSSGTLRLFMNGALVGSGASSTNITIGATNTFYIGNRSGGGDSPQQTFNGYLSNLRVVKGTGLYTSAFTPSTTPLTSVANTSLLTCQSNRLMDNSPRNAAITKGGDTSVQAFGPFGSIPEAVPISYSNYFDGTGDQLITTTSTNLALESSDFTIELWYYPTGRVQSYPVLISNGNFGSQKWQINDRHQAFPTKVSVNLYAGSSGDGWLVSTTTISVNTWYHVALVRSGSTFTLYINGIAEQSKTLSGSITAATDFITLGQDQNQGVTCYTGYISNARIVKGTAVYTSNFTPSTTPLTAIANTSLLTCQSTTMIDNSTNRFTITANGNVTPRIFNPFGYTAQSATSYTPSLHGGSIYLDGTVDNLYSSTISKYGSTNHTIECWVFFNNVSSRQSILNSGWGTGSYATDGGWTLDIAGTNAGGINFALGTMASGSFWIGPGTGVGSFTVGQWYHIAIVRNSTTVTIYSNGVSIATGTLTASTTVMSNMGVLRIGAYDGNGFPFNGYISDVRVSSGALYTSNFVSPTVPLTPTVTIGANTFTAGILVNGATGGIIDQHGTNVLETVGNTQLSTAVKKYNSASMYFDGTGDYLTTPAKDSLSFGTGDFTVEAWVYFASIAADRGILGSSGVGGYDFVWRTSNGLNIGRINTAFDNSFAFTPVVNTWYHIAYSRSGTSLRAFVDGTQVGTTATNSTAYNSVTAVIVGGSTTSDRLMNGYIDDLRITKGYARYTSNFTPPSALITK